MEVMSISLDKFYKFVHITLKQMIPEAVLGKLTVAVSFLCHCVVSLFILM